MLHKYVCFKYVYMYIYKNTYEKQVVSGGRLERSEVVSRSRGLQLVKTFKEPSAGQTCDDFMPQKPK